MYRPRILRGPLEKAVQGYPATLVTGPRQAGKTTLLRHALGDSHSYVSLENPNLQEAARADAEGFLKDQKRPLLLDEIQYVPELLPYIKTEIDRDRKKGEFVLTGSQVFPLMAGVTESLAGRVAILNLLPFSFGEVQDDPQPFEQQPNQLLENILHGQSGIQTEVSLAEWLLRGGYPALWDGSDLDRQMFLGSYVQSYLERDARALAQIENLGLFQTFVRMVASRTGQLLNMTSIARDVGISVPTVKTWLHILEASHQILLLRPHHNNFGKRLTKSPKVYWIDTGIATYLMSQHSKQAVLEGPNAGALFETAVVIAFHKMFSSRGVVPPLWFYRSYDGFEVDLLIEWDGKLHPIEIKSTRTPRPKHVENVRKYQELVGLQAGEGLLVCSIEESRTVDRNVRAVPWQGIG